MTNEVCAKLGKNLYLLRTERRYSITQLSKKSCISKTTIENIEKGKGNPLLGTLLQLAKTLKVKPSSLCKGI